MHTQCGSRTASVFVSKGSKRVKTAMLSFKFNQRLLQKQQYFRSVLNSLFYVSIDLYPQTKLSSYAH